MKAILSQIIAQYGLPPTTPVTELRVSSDNDVYSVGTNQKKILRISKHLPAEDVRFEYEALQYCQRNGIPVTQWVKTRAGDLYASIDEATVAVMFDYLTGNHITIDHEHLPTPSQAKTAGTALGKFAAIGAAFHPSGVRRRTVFTELERVLSHETEFRHDFLGGTEFVDQVKRALAFGRSPATLGLIHNDYRAGNIFFSNDHEVSGIIDFDWSCIGPIIKDCALGVLEWSFPDGRTKPNFTVFDAFLDGYNATATEKISRGVNLYSWIQFAALSDTATYFCDRLTSPDLKRDISYSYMYRKYLFFSSQ